MFTWYTFLLSIHVLAAAIWIGSAFMAQVLTTRARRADAAELPFLAKQIEWYGQRFLSASSLVLLLAGFGMVADGSWSLGQTWLVLALIAFAASFVAGIAFIGPNSKRVGEAMEASRGDVTPEIRALMARLFLVSRLELVVLILVVFDMVMKPGS